MINPLYRKFWTCSLVLYCAVGSHAYGVETVIAEQNNWGTGYCANITLTNNESEAITDWTLTLDPKNATIQNLWSATLTNLVVTPLNGQGNIAVGQSTSFGFCASTNDNSTAQIATIGDLHVVSASNPPPPTDPAPTDPDAGEGSPDTGSNGTYPPLESGCQGYATRFWDCCKPHCGWVENVPDGMSALKSCSVANLPLPDFSTQSACQGGDAHTCFNLAPFKVSETLSYGFAATSSGDVCGRCYQLQFTGSSHNGGDDPGSVALKGKTMIIQAMNIGYDVSGGQFDLLVPGGGVGAYNACSAQWGIPASELGSQYGGLLAACKNELGWNASLAQYKSCLSQRCDSVFGSRGLTDMQAGCQWYADWFEAADNPKLIYQEVACPAALIERSGMDRGQLSVSQVCP